ncbi:hypothetical protein DAEQUDRAFT_810829 [Daedalea quercina L-15889]|uniref:Uncharacterized protein n=1 Tax=Daedalea quercina L-15889 TaxID=1314783 RepID=A0A165QYK5_9APHY|nr:hypothetical protein DAEQUDRAFT_810829 [Daedalea quercina L-15889]
MVDVSEVHGINHAYTSALLSHRATTKPPIPPVNLKDRIAALQQRNAGSNQSDARQPSSLTNGTRATGSLRDRIASFEKQGAVPVPRGSFGLGAPPVDDGSSRRRGELIGNRVPGLSRPVAPVPTHPPRATSPSSPGRVRAASATIQSRASSRSTSPTLSADGEVESAYSSPEAALEESASPRSPRHSGTWQARRRSVSDIVAKFSVPVVVGEPLPEGQEKADPSPPAIIISQEQGDMSAESYALFTDTEQASTVALGALAQDVQSEGSQCVTDEQLPPAVVSPSDADEPSPSADSEPDARTVIAPAERIDPPVTPDVLAAPEAPPAADAWDQVATAVLPSPVEAMSSESSGVTMSTTPQSDAEVYNIAEFNTAEVVADEVTSPTESLPEVPSTLPIPEESIASPSADPAPTVPTPVQPQVQLIVDTEEPGNQSLALDTQEVVIVTEPPRVVTPVVTRAVLIPVSPISPSPVDQIRPEPTPSFVEPSLTPKTATGSFRAVVHHKVAEGGRRSTSSQAARVSDLRVAVDSPQSPGFTDLADLLADAALLEQQLSALGSPRKLPSGNAFPSTPPSASALRNVSAPRVEVTIPEHLSDEVSTSGHGHSSSEYHSPQEFPSIPEPRTPSPVTPPKDRHRSRIVSDAEPKTPGPVTPVKEHLRGRLLSDTPPPVPPKSPRPRYFSTLLTRRPSTTKDSLMPMPGAYPRNSICSEMSEDDSVLVATPPSPRFDALGSDTSSVMSSNRSWKMPSKGLARATSFADRLWHKRNNRNTVVIATPGKQHLHVRKSQDSSPYSLNAGYPDDDGHLSANPAVRPRKSEPMPTLPQLDLSPSTRAERPLSANADDRPMSWVSVSSSIGSAGLDSALFDAFPSVPDTVPAIPDLSEDSGLSPHVSPSEPRDSMSSRSGNFPPRSSSLHPKQRSSIL